MSPCASITLSFLYMAPILQPWGSSRSDIFLLTTFEVFLSPWIITSNNSASPKPKEWTFTTSLALTDAKSEPIVTSSGDTTTSISLETNLRYEGLFIIAIDFLKLIINIKYF